VKWGREMELGQRFETSDGTWCLSIGFEVLDLLLNLIGGVSVKSENNNRNQYQTADHLERARHLQL
jgi:hypothetical protein